MSATVCYRIGDCRREALILADHVNRFRLEMEAIYGERYETTAIHIGRTSHAMPPRITEAAVEVAA